MVVSTIASTPIMQKAATQAAPRYSPSRKRRTGPDYILL